VSSPAWIKRHLHLNWDGNASVIVELSQGLGWAQCHRNVIGMSVHPVTSMSAMSSSATPRNPLQATDPYAREHQIFPTLTPEQIKRTIPFGSEETLTLGTVLFERGDREVDFFIVLDGFIEIFENSLDQPKVILVHLSQQFTGELDLFNRRKILVGGRMGEDGRVLRISPESFRRLITAEPDIGEIIMRAFILRRTAFISHAQGGVTLIDPSTSADGVRLERFLRRNGYPITAMRELDHDYEAVMQRFGLTPDQLPVVVIHLNDQLLSRPSNHELAEALGLVEEIDCSEVVDVAIVGGGPAGLSAAVYAASEGLTTLLLEAEAPGGQASTSSKIENYLGFPTGISGEGLAGRAQIQAMKFGATICLPKRVTGLDCSQYPYGVQFSAETEKSRTVRARSVVIATGATYRTLGLVNSDDFDNSGIYYAATALEGDICRNEEVIVVGGGNSAGQATVFLSSKARHVHLLIRRESLVDTMSDYLIGRILSSDRITLHSYTEIVELEGDRHLEGVTWKNIQTGDLEKHPIRHVFLMIGAQPNTGWLPQEIQTDRQGFILTGQSVDRLQNWCRDRAPMNLETSQPGVFAVGDVQSGSTKRVASGVGLGAISVSHIHAFLAEQAEAASE
jgi:thioredoxin reductase (NADPH)